MLQRIRAALLVDPRVLHSDSLAKYAAAFRRISISIFSRMFSARRRDNSICSGLIGLPWPLPSLPAFAALRQFARVCSLIPSCLATAVLGGVGIVMMLVETRTAGLILAGTVLAALALGTYLKRIEMTL